MTKTDFFLNACISIACKAFETYPEYNQASEPYYHLPLDQRETFDPTDADRPSPTKEEVWVSQVLNAADALTAEIDKNGVVI